MSHIRHIHDQFKDISWQKLVNQTNDLFHIYKWKIKYLGMNWTISSLTSSNSSSWLAHGVLLLLLGLCLSLQQPKDCQGYPAVPLSVRQLDFSNPLFVHGDTPVTGSLCVCVWMSAYVCVSTCTKMCIMQWCKLFCWHASALVFAWCQRCSTPRSVSYCT